MCLKYCCIAGSVANSVDPDQMPHSGFFAVCIGLSVPILSDIHTGVITVFTIIVLFSRVHSPQSSFLLNDL